MGEHLVEIFITDFRVQRGGGTVEGGSGSKERNCTNLFRRKTRDSNNNTNVGV